LLHGSRYSEIKARDMKRIPTLEMKLLNKEIKGCTRIDRIKKEESRK
jgi:hypothetical protein